MAACTATLWAICWLHYCTSPTAHGTTQRRNVSHTSRRGRLSWLRQPPHQPRHKTSIDEPHTVYTVQRYSSNPLNLLKHCKGTCCPLHTQACPAFMFSHLCSAGQLLRLRASGRAHNCRNILYRRVCWGLGTVSSHKSARTWGRCPCTAVFTIVAAV